MFLFDVFKRIFLFLFACSVFGALGAYNLIYITSKFLITPILFNYHNLFQLSQSFSIITIFFNHWRRGVVVITAAQLHSTKPELRFCAGSNPARGVSEIRDGEDL